MSKPTEQDVEKAKEVLREAGYFVDNLWHIEDVLTKTDEDLDEDTCQEILDTTVHSDYIVESINDAIQHELDYEMENYQQ